MRIAVPEFLRKAIGADLPSDAEVVWYADGAQAAGAARGCEVIYLHFWSRAQIAEAVAAASELRWVATTGAGVDFLPLDAIRGRGIMLTSGAGLPTIPVAEFTVMAMLAAAKGLPALVRAHDSRVWLQAPGRIELWESRALILGYGSIGRRVGALLRPFGVEVSAVRRAPGGEPDVIGPDDWRGRLGTFDWVILAAAATAETRGMIAGEELHAMRSSAWLINIARGALIDEAALVRALHQGEIAGAYLDVTSTEPLPADHPLWSTPNTLITAHSSGAATTRMAQRAGGLFLENLDRYRRGEPMRNLVDLERGY